MIQTSIAKIAEDIGFDIANSDDKVQGNLLNGLGRGFKMFQPHNFSMQISYLVDKLNPETEHLILELAEFIKLKNAKSTI